VCTVLFENAAGENQNITYIPLRLRILCAAMKYYEFARKVEITCIKSRVNVLTTIKLYYNVPLPAYPRFHEYEKIIIIIIKTVYTTI